MPDISIRNIAPLARATRRRARCCLEHTQPLACSMTDIAGDDGSVVLGATGDGGSVVLGATGVALPQIGCGTMFLRGKLCEEAVGTALGLGYRLVDTASMYGNEKEVGAAIARSGVPRAELRVVSKLKPDDMGYDATLAACAESLAELGLSYLDVYLVHAPGGSRTKRLDTWRAMEVLLASGKCRAIGVSNYMQRHLRELENHASLSVTPHVIQSEFSPVCQQHELRAFCAERGIAWMAHTPFGGKGAPLLRDGRLQPACRQLGASPAQVVLGWCQHHGVIAIPKTQSQVRIRENSAPCPLDAPAIAALDAMDPLPAGVVPVAPQPAPVAASAQLAAAKPAVPVMTASAAVMEGAKALMDVVTGVVGTAEGGGCAWFGGVSPAELIGFARSELVEVEEELATLTKLKVEAVGELVATVSWAGGPGK